MGIFGDLDRTNIWLQDLRSGLISRVTFLPGKFPAWSPDGSSLAFARQDSATVAIYRKVMTGERQEELLINAGVNGVVFDWSPDGKWLIYHRQDAKTGLDLWLLPLQGDRRPVPYLQTPFNETLAAFSPDSRWIAYQSDESGRNQIYIQSIAAIGAKYQISNNGGAEPQWRRDGKELFFISDGKLVAVPIVLGTRIEAGNSQTLFSTGDVTDYAPTRDGRRFLMSVAPSGEGGESQETRSITVVLNWATSLNP